MNITNRSYMTFLAVVLFSFVSLAGQGQTQNDHNRDYTLGVDVDLVQLPISVVDKDGRLVDDLTINDFQVFEDGIQQEISIFKHEDIPLSIGLVIDNSGSMRNKRERVNSAALTFARESNPDDETFIVNFDNDAYLEQDFTNQIEDLIRALDNLDTRGETALYDAVYLSVDHLREGTKDKKAILLISDGEDNTSKYSLNKVIESLRASNVTLYAIGLLEDKDPRGALFKRAPSQKAKDALQKFVATTGGQAYFPKSINEVEGLCRRIAHDIRNHYTIAYSPADKSRDGSWRTIKVKVNVPRLKSATVRTKPGYYALAPEARSH